MAFPFLRLPLPLRLCGLGLLANPLAAQTPIGGNQSGTLPPGVYVTTSSLTVPTNQTWALSAGVIIKFTSSGHELTVNGTLNTNGTALNKVILTDYADDSAGGDTNGNGPSLGNATAWRGVVFNGTGGGTLNYADVRYGGAGYVANVLLNGSSPTLANCVLRNCYVSGLNCGGNSTPTVTNCVFTDNGAYAVDDVPIQALVGFSGNAASGNASGNYARVTVANVTGNVSVPPSAHVNGAVVFDTSLVIAQGGNLTLQAGAVLKMRNSGIEVTVDGTLTVSGTAGNPVVLTDLADDSAGGDTNTNGPSSGTATAWRGIVFNATGGGTLDYADVRYGGAGYVANVHLNSSAPTLTHCVLRNCYVAGLSCNGNSTPTVSNCTFTGNGSYAIDDVPIQALGGLSGNTATNNASGNYARVTVANVTGNVSVPPSAHINGAIVLDTSIAIAAGGNLTLQPGTVLKMKHSGIEVTVDGTLTANGTAANPVVFTDLADDSAGGDTNTNGASTGTPTAWRGIVYRPGSGGTLTWADVRYGGAGYVSNVHVNGGSPTLEHCTLRKNYVAGMNLNGNVGATVKNCSFVDNGSWPVDQVPLAALPGFTTNVASGNVAGNGMHVTSATVSGPLTLGPQSVVAGAHVLASAVTVTATGALTVQQGVAFKFENSGGEVVVNGTCNLLGTSYEPVVFTAYSDDAIGGDTNNNGPSASSAAAWRGITYTATATASRVENVLVRYAGAGFLAGFSCASSAVSVRALRADSCYDRGIELSAVSGNPCNLVAWGCGSQGVHLTGGSFDLVHATACANGTGIRREAAWTGNAVNSISRGNGTNFGNFSASQAQFCNGAFASGSGNIDVDPLFVNPAIGDLHLQPTSPCIGVADLLPAFLTGKDFDENSRLLDAASTGLPLPDMGAFERPMWDMNVGGYGQLGTTLTYTVTGPPGVSFYLLGFLDGFTPLAPYGMVLVAAQPSSVLILTAAPLPTNTPFPIALPNLPILAGFTAGVQTVTLSASSASIGNLTRLHRLLLRP